MLEKIKKVKLAIACYKKKNLRTCETILLTNDSLLLTVIDKIQFSEKITLHLCYIDQYFKSQNIFSAAPNIIGSRYIYTT